jgi:TPR repeat protein
MTVGAAGDRIGPYRLVRELGRGGMGEVWLGEHVEIRSQVAIKLMRPDPSGARDGLDRFLREAKATARIRHPGIISVTDFGATAAGGAYLVMELLDGESLAARLARGRLDVATAVELGVQIGEALAAAHAEGIIHRDLKPGNVFLVRDAAARRGMRVKLLDFGVAKALGKVTDEVGLTITGELVGTPLYMAPEQCASRLGPVDARTDLYALGVVLYEALTGRAPFTGPTLGDLLDQHLNATPVPPRTIVAEIPDAVDALVIALLAKRRDDRPAGARLVVRTLARALDGGRDEPAPVDDVSLDETAQPGALAATAATGDGAALDATAADTGSELRSDTADAAPIARAAKASASMVAPRPHPRRRRRAMWIAIAAAVVVAIGAVATWRLVRSDRAAAPPVASATDGALRDRCGRRDGAACLELARRELRLDRPALGSVFGWYQTACDAGDGEGCDELAAAYADGVGVKVDATRAAALYRSGCDAGRGRACAGLADHLLAGVGVAADRDAAMRVAARGCELDDPQACLFHARFTAFSLAAAERLAARVEFERAAALANRACDGGDGVACYTFASIHHLGYLGTVDRGRSFTLFQRACDHGLPSGCAEVGATYMIGDSVPREPERGLAMVRQACDAGDGRACVAYGIDLATGVGGERDGATARAVLTTVCEDRGDRYCDGLGFLYALGRDVPKDPARALALGRRACVAGIGLGCQLAASVGTDLPAEERSALTQRGCDLGVAGICDELGVEAYKAKDHEAAAEAFHLACEMSGGRNGCSRLAELYLHGEGVERDAARATELFVRACDRGDVSGCYRYAMRLVDGRDVPSDPLRGLELLEEVCAQSWPAGCAAAADLLTAGKGVTADPVRAHELRDLACKGSPKFCPGGSGAGSGSGSSSGSGR